MQALNYKDYVKPLHFKKWLLPLKNVLMTAAGCAKLGETEGGNVANLSTIFSKVENKLIFARRFASMPPDQFVQLMQSNFLKGLNTATKNYLTGLDREDYDMCECVSCLALDPVDGSMASTQFFLGIGRSRSRDASMLLKNFCYDEKVLLSFGDERKLLRQQNREARLDRQAIDVIAAPVEEEVNGEIEQPPHNAVILEDLIIQAANHDFAMDIEEMSDGNYHVGHVLENDEMDWQVNGDGENEEMDLVDNLDDEHAIEENHVPFENPDFELVIGNSRVIGSIFSWNKISCAKSLCLVNESLSEVSEINPFLASLVTEDGELHPFVLHILPVASVDTFPQLHKDWKVYAGKRAFDRFDELQIPRWALVKDKGESFTREQLNGMFQVECLGHCFNRLLLRLSQNGSFTVQQENNLVLVDVWRLNQAVENFEIYAEGDVEQESIEEFFGHLTALRATNENFSIFFRMSQSRVDNIFLQLLDMPSESEFYLPLVEFVKTFRHARSVAGIVNDNMTNENCEIFENAVRHFESLQFFSGQLGGDTLAREIAATLNFIANKFRVTNVRFRPSIFMIDVHYAIRNHCVGINLQALPPARRIVEMLQAGGVLNGTSFYSNIQYALGEPGNLIYDANDRLIEFSERRVIFEPFVNDNDRALLENHDLGLFANYHDLDLLRALSIVKRAKETQETVYFNCTQAVRDILVIFVNNN